MAKKINYFARNFADTRQELINFVKQYYPEVFNDFNDSSVGMMLLELNAAVGDNLAFHTDRMFQETQIDYAQERSSLLSMARTFGLKIPNKRPSVTIVDFSVNVPVRGDTFDIRYAPIIRRGGQVSGAGKVFETRDDIDFSSPFTTGGIPNRTVIPNTDANGTITSYTLTKRELVVNGVTKIFKRVITAADVRPFFEVVLPDTDVLNVESIISLEGTNYTKTPTIDQFLDFNKRFFEVDALADDTVFIEDKNSTSTTAGVKVGKYERITRKFITEFTDLGFKKIIFGGGSQDIGSICQFDVPDSLVNQVGDFINNLSLGETLNPNQTLFIQYRVGGGQDTNIGPNVVSTVKTVNMSVNGPDNTINTSVRSSLSVNNPIPAVGGKEGPSIEELRYLIKYNFSAQNRCVTIPDYKARIALMPSEFGAPYRSGVLEEQNKIKIYTLGLDSSGNLSNQTTSAMKQNLAEYLSDYRMINDFVEVDSGRIINLAFEVDLYVDKQYPQSQIIAQTISEIQSHMNKENFDMGQNIYLSQLLEKINNVGGVLNVIDLRVFNKVGEGKYSLNEIAQPYVDEDTREIDLLGEYTLFGDPISMFEVKYPNQDIKVRVK
jgi:hypothetical protein